MIEIKGENGFVVHIDDRDIKSFGIEPEAKESLFIVYGERRIDVNEDVRGQYRKLVDHFNHDRSVVSGIRMEVGDNAEEKGGIHASSVFRLLEEKQRD